MAVRQQITVTAAGLYLAPNDLGAVPDGALAQADNVCISKDGITEQRRGLAAVATKALNRLALFKGYLVGWSATGVMSRSSDYASTWVDYSGTYLKPGAAQIKTVEASGNLYFTTSVGIERLDSFTGTPEPAGVPGGLDVQAVIAAAGTAVPVDTQVAYRLVWGKRDANGNLLLGAPTGRAVITNPKSYIIAIGSLARVSTTVTATLAAGATNVLTVGDTITLSPGETNFALGVKTVTGVTPTTFTYTESGSAVSSTAEETFVGPAKDITISGSIPQGLPTGAFYQVYRSPNSNLATVTPSDELGLIYEGTPPAPATLSSLSRSSTTVTATTTAAHGYQAGMLVRIPSSVGGATVIAAVGSSLCATSPDGSTWTAQTMPAGNWRAVCSTGSLFCAVSDSSAGVGGAATSTDGVTWAVHDMPGTAGWTGVAWNGAVFCAVGVSSACATSPDGVTWTSRTISTGNWYAIAWSGSAFAAVGAATGANGAASSPDGTTWTLRTIPGVSGGNPLTLNGVAWDGDQFVTCGDYDVLYGSQVFYRSADGATWVAVGSLPITGGNTASVASSGTLNCAVGAYYTGTNNSMSDTQPAGSSATWAMHSDLTGQGALYGVAWAASKFVAVGSSRAATSTDGATWTARTIPAGAYAAVAAIGVGFSAGAKLILTVPAPATFTYTEGGIAGTMSSTQTLVPLTFAFTDNVPSGFIGSALYTDPNQGTITASADRVALCADIAAFRGFLFASNITYPSKASFYLLSLGGTGGLQAGDTITIDGLAYVADATTESPEGRTFVAYTSGTPSQNIANTVQSLIRVINRTYANTITARYLSGADEVPGLVYVEKLSASTTMTLAFSRPTVWSIQSQKGPENRKNELRWSSSGQPDAMPLVNFQGIGSLDRTIQRILPTRDMLVIVKDDGLWRLTGWNGVWDIQPLDPTMGTPSSDSLVPFENAMFGVLDSGVARATESGVEMLSTPIYNAIEPLIAPAMVATLESVGFGIAYHSSHKFLLWLPSASTDTVATQAYVYDSWTNAWTRWTPPTGVAGWAHGLVNPTDDRLYMVDGVSVYREKKVLDDTDLQDATGTAIQHTVKFSPKFGGNPGQLHRFQEIALVFRRVRFGSAEVGFSTNVSPEEEVITLVGDDYGISTSVGTQTTIRVLVPLEKSRASQLNVRFTHEEPGSPAQLQGLSVIYRTTSSRVSR